MDAIHAGESADSVCEVPLAMFPGLRITIPRKYNNNGILVWHGAKDTFSSGLGVEVTYHQFLTAWHWHLFLCFFRTVFSPRQLHDACPSRCFR